MEYLPCSTLCDNPNHFRQLLATSSSKNDVSSLMYVTMCRISRLCHYAKLSFIHIIGGTGRNTVSDFFYYLHHQNSNRTDLNLEESHFLPITGFQI